MAVRIKKYQYCFFFVFLFSLSGCSLLEKNFTPSDTAIYAEVLFKQQNVLTQQLMMLFDEDFTEAEMDILSQAELDMHDACRLLNEMANKELEGQTMSLYFKKRVQGSFEVCDKSVQRLQLILISMEGVAQ